MRWTVLLGVMLAACADAPDGLHGVPVDMAQAPADLAGLDLTGVDLAQPPSSAPDLVQPAAGALDPPRGAGSGGTGGTATGGVAQRTTGGGVAYRLIVPSSYSAAQKTALLVVYSGTEGGAQMASNLLSLEAAIPGLASTIRAVLDGVTYNGNGQAGADVLDHVRAQYHVDNDRTYLLGESAGTTAAFKLGFHLRQGWFAAYWANDVSAAQADGPEKTAAQLGFQPWGQVGPGGASALASAIAQKIIAAGYRTDPTTPYAGAGAGTHGSPQQFMAALAWFDGKSR